MALTNWYVSLIAFIDWQQAHVTILRVAAQTKRPDASNEGEACCSARTNGMRCGYVPQRKDMGRCLYECGTTHPCIVASRSVTTA